MVDAFMKWEVGLGEGGLEGGAPGPFSEGGLQLRVVDVFRESSQTATLISTYLPRLFCTPDRCRRQCIWYRGFTCCDGPDPMCAFPSKRGRLNTPHETF